MMSLHQKAGRLPNDDFMSPSAEARNQSVLGFQGLQEITLEAQWSTSGRGDLQIMKKLGANTVMNLEESLVAGFSLQVLSHAYEII